MQLKLKTAKEHGRNWLHDLLWPCAPLYSISLLPAWACHTAQYALPPPCSHISNLVAPSKHQPQRRQPWGHYQEAYSLSRAQPGTHCPPPPLPPAFWWSRHQPRSSHLREQMVLLVASIVQFTKCVLLSISYSLYWDWWALQCIYINHTVPCHIATPHHCAASMSI